MNIKIVVATHKECDMPKDDIYLPIQVGKALHTDLNLGYQPDNDGENISAKNPYYSELTALYWAWKNLKADYVGLVHYRRHFLGQKKSKDKDLDCVLKEEQLQSMLDKYKVFVPKKRRYYVETIYSHYVHTMNGGKEQLDTVRAILVEKNSEYLNAFDQVMRRTWAYMFNIMILRRDLRDSYCEWLFDILFELEKRIDTAGMSDFDKRYMGRVSERLFNVWLQHQLELGIVKPNEIKELPYTEEVDWFAKVKSFISAKLFNKKYGASF